MSTIYTLRDLVDYCYNNRNTRAYRNHTYEEIARDIVSKNLYNGVVYVEDSQGICGVCVFSVFHDLKQVYIHQIIAQRAGFRTLIHEARRRYPGYKIQGKRKDTIKTFKHLEIYG